MIDLRNTKFFGDKTLRTHLLQWTFVYDSTFYLGRSAIYSLLFRQKCHLRMKIEYSKELALAVLGEK